MKRYIKSGYYLGDYYVSDAEAEELQYYADHPEMLKGIPDKPVDRSKYPETYDFRQHKAEIDAGVAEANSKFGKYNKWSVSVSANVLKLYWGYFQELELQNPYIEITYNKPDSAYDVWFKIVDPEGENLTYSVEFNDSVIASMIVGLAGYITNRW
mgnify:FL=1